MEPAQHGLGLADVHRRSYWNEQDDRISVEVGAYAASYSERRRTWLVVTIRRIRDLVRHLAADDPRPKLFPCREESSAHGSHRASWPGTKLSGTLRSEAFYRDRNYKRQDQLRLAVLNHGDWSFQLLCLRSVRT